MIYNLREIKLTYESWLEEWKKRHCEACLIGVPANCYLCHRERKIGFCCSRCLHFVYYSETQSVAGDQSQICGGFYDTGSCFCADCQGIIKKHLKDRSCACEFSLVGYSAGHSIHNYRLTINGLIKPLFKGSKLWIKLVCRSCERVIGSFKLNCWCYLEQKKHQHLYSRKRCLSCAVGDYVRPLSEWDLRQKYRQYCQDWQERAEVHAQLSIKQQYKYDGESYWAKCSFCPSEIRGKIKDKEPLSRNKVSFWIENEADERIICNGCLRKKKVLKGLEIKGSKKQMLYNYRLRRII